MLCIWCIMHVSLKSTFLLDSLRIELTDHMFRENSLVSVYVF